MKKLLITAIGAAVAFGAFADAVRFEESAAGTVTALSQLPGGASFWFEPAGSTNTYAIGDAGLVTAPLSIASALAAPTNEAPTKALDIKTTFGKPLSLNAVSGGAATNINDGLYFDSLVKFTVCDAGQDAAMYDGAKIVMWLEQNEAETQTNLIVRAGYLSLSGDTVTLTTNNYVCALPDTFNIDAWHRVTIKAIADITKTNRGVPGFAIYLDQNGDTATSDINIGTPNMWDDSFPASELTEAADLLNRAGALFPSLDVTSGNKATLTSASFDGTGSITDLIFTDNGPAFAQDMASDKVSIKIGDNTEQFTTLDDAIDALNAKTAESATEVTFKLMAGMTLAKSPIAINNTDDEVEVVIDLNGCGITNSVGATLTIQSPVTIIDSSDAKTGEIVTTGNGDDDYAILVNGSGNLTLTAGTIVGYMAKVGDDAAITVSGGTINQDAGYELAEGKEAVDSDRGEGFYDIVDAPAAVAQITGGAKYATLKEAVDAAQAGDTVTVLADCTVAEPITFTNGINIVNNYTITINGANYALRIANGTTTPVTWSGTGSLVWLTGSGSPIIVGSNEKKPTYGINEFYEGSFVLNGGTLTSTDATAKGGNLVKLEAGTFVLNDGMINGGTRGVKADSEGNNATCVLTINGGTIVNTNTAAIAASTAGSGSSTVTVNAGTFTGKLAGTGMVTIPGTSTAKFDRDQSEFCESGYETTLSDGWYVVTAVKPSGIDPETNTPVEIEAESAVAATNAVTLVTPDGVNATAYKNLFDFTVTEVVAGEKYTVEIAGIKEEVKEDVSEDAVTSLVTAAEDSSATTVTVNVPAGLYYKVTTYDTIGGAAVDTETGISSGSTKPVDKPTSATQGFIKVEMATKPFNQ